jgi:hypothetical protein
VKATVERKTSVKWLTVIVFDEPERSAIEARKRYGSSEVFIVAVM